MFGFSKEPRKESLLGYKKIIVNGMRFTIKKVNPLIDFPPDKIPQIFTDFISRRKPPEKPTEIEFSKAKNDMSAIIKAGIVSPELSNNEKEGITVDDLFRDPTMGPKLYIEIMSHSLNYFKGLKGLFFYQKIKLSFWMQWLKDMGRARRQSLLMKASH